MKNLLIVVLFLKWFFFFSQNSKNDIYIFIAKKPSIEVVNDSILFQKFVIDYNTDYNGKEVKLSIDKIIYK